MTTRKSKRKPHHLPQGLIVPEGTSVKGLADYIIAITPQQKAQFYEEAYQLFMTIVKGHNPRCYEEVKKMEEELQSCKGMGMVLYVFKRVAPTFCDNKPIVFLRNALKQACQEDRLDMLCVFMQIAAFRWALVEKSFKTTAMAREGRKGHAWIYTAEGRVLGGIFESMRLTQKDFHVGYRSWIIPVLMAHKEILIPNLKKIVQNQKAHKDKNEWQDTKTLVDQIQDEFNLDEVDLEKIKDMLLQIEPLERQFRDKYRRFCKNNKCLVFFFQSIQQSFLLSELQATLWQKLSPWPIEACLKNYYPELADVIPIVMQESCFLAQS